MWESAALRRPGGRHRGRSPCSLTPARGPPGTEPFHRPCGWHHSSARRGESGDAHPAPGNPAGSASRGRGGDG
eukprot:5155841-Ditylum_brightwellii.AAC.1